VPLETVDLEGVEIMAAGERVHGQGSPEDGEVFDSAKLAQIASDSNLVVDEVQPFQKLGHNDEQKLLKASGFYTDDDQPATGWLRNFRVEDGKLKADAQRVPKAFADLIRAHAFRRRSAELIRHTSQDGAQREVVGALAWLGAKRPAFKTLGDVAALYEDAPPSGEVRFTESEDADAATAELSEPIVDVIFKAFVAALAGSDASRASDSRERMPDNENTQQVRQFAEVVGLDDAASGDQVLERIKTLVAEAEQAKASAAKAQDEKKEYGERLAALEQRSKAADDAVEELRVMRRDKLFSEAIAGKKLPPAMRDDLVKKYDESPEAAQIVTSIVQAMPPRDDLVRAFGSDATPTDTQRASEEALSLVPLARGGN
jgi:hypothetical protein